MIIASASKSLLRSEWEKSYKRVIDGKNFSRIEEKNSMIGVFGIKNCCNERINGEIDSF